MSRTFEIDAVLEEFPGHAGYKLYCFEDDDCVYDCLFPTRREAEYFGRRFVNGDFKDGFLILDSDYNDIMDGDHDSAMASAGFGTDEDYGYYGED